MNFDMTSDVVERLYQAIESLDEREQKVLMLYYFEGMTLEVAGKQFGVTRERVRQIRTKALNNLRYDAAAILGMEDEDQAAWRLARHHGHESGRFYLLTRLQNYDRDTNMNADKIRKLQALAREASDDDTRLRLFEKGVNLYLLVSDDHNDFMFVVILDCRLGVPGDLQRYMDEAEPLDYWPTSHILALAMIAVGGEVIGSLPDGWDSFKDPHGPRAPKAMAELKRTV
jgi:hypothetical protein